MISRAVILAGLLCLSACVIALMMMAPDRLLRIKPGMSADQVEAILGRPASIEQSATADQTLSGEIDHYLPDFRRRGETVASSSSTILSSKPNFFPGVK